MKNLLQKRAPPIEVVTLGTLIRTPRDNSRCVGNPSLTGLWKGCP
jgi:hypothetical protein